MLVLSIRRIENARLSVTAMGRPSGTDTTSSATASMKVFRPYWSASSQLPLKSEKYMPMRPMMMIAAMT